MKTGRRSSVHRCDDVDGAWKKTAPDVVAETICRISKIEAVAPRVKEIVFNEGKAIITFDSAKLGLVPRDGDIPNFELAGDDRVFHNASAPVHKTALWVDDRHFENQAGNKPFDSVPA